LQYLQESSIILFPVIVHDDGLTQPSARGMELGNYEVGVWQKREKGSLVIWMVWEPPMERLCQDWRSEFCVIPAGGLTVRGLLLCSVTYCIQLLIISYALD